MLGLWRQTAGLDSVDGEDLLTLLDELSLLIDLDLGRGLFRLHDVFRSLLSSGPAKDRLAELDSKLMAYFRLSCPDGDLALLKDSYGLRHAIAHLRGAGESEAGGHSKKLSACDHRSPQAAFVAGVATTVPRVRPRHGKVRSPRASS